MLDRYLFRLFFLPFVYCELGFYTIWLIYDLSTNINDFIEAHVPILSILKFYLSQTPAIAVLTIPVGLLLALLYSVTKLSQSNEIIAMLNAGRSLERILTPFFLVGLMLTVVSGVLNYKLAPHAEANREVALAELESGTGKFKKRTHINGYLFANRSDHRIWYIERMPTNLKEPLFGIQIVQENEKNKIIGKIYAGSAVYIEPIKQWKFSNGTKIVEYNSSGDIRSEKFPSEYEITNWSETPWRIASAMLKADHLSIPELHQYLNLNGDFSEPLLAPYHTYLWYRYAFPWSCIVIVLISAPLAVVYTRRNVIFGVATALSLFFCNLFLDNLFRALGRGYRIPASWAAWTPIVLFSVIGLVFLRIRSLNRDRLPRNLADIKDLISRF